MDSRYKKIVIWGTGVDYNQHLINFKYLEEIGEILVLGVTGNDKYYINLDGYQFIPKAELTNIVDFDYIVVASKKYNEICQEARLMGISMDKLVPVSALDIPFFTFDKYISLVRKKISIIACNCWGGVTYHYFNLPFLSPFINMFVEDSDFVRLAANFKQYMENDLRLFKTQYNSELGITYPVFLLGDVKIYMNHYADFDYAVKKWEERKSRINWDELFFMLFTLSIDVAKDFSETVKKGVCFVPFSCNENLVMQLGFYKKIVDAENDFYKVVVGMAKGQYNYYDVWELLLNNRFIYRG